MLIQPAIKLVYFRTIASRGEDAAARQRHISLLAAAAAAAALRQL
jgi:hypothetical protein